MNWFFRWFDSCDPYQHADGRRATCSRPVPTAAQRDRQVGGRDTQENDTNGTVASPGRSRAGSTSGGLAAGELGAVNATGQEEDQAQTDVGWTRGPGIGSAKHYVQAAGPDQDPKAAIGAIVEYGQGAPDGGGGRVFARRLVLRFWQEDQTPVTGTVDDGRRAAGLGDQNVGKVAGGRPTRRLHAPDQNSTTNTATAAQPQ